MRASIFNTFLSKACIGGIACALLAAPAPAEENYPLLDQLNRETQSLYRETSAGLVRVQLPTPKWLRKQAAGDDPLKKWDSEVDGQLKSQLQTVRDRIITTGEPVKVDVRLYAPTTQPSTRPTGNKNAPADGGTVGGWNIKRSADGRDTVLESRDPNAGVVSFSAGGERPANPAGPVRPAAVVAGAFAPNNIGILLDEAGHVLIPLFIEKETVGQTPVKVAIADAETTAQFVGSDEKTNLTLLKMFKVVGKPVRIAQSRPGSGSLVMLLNPNSGAGRLQIWTGGEKDYGVVVSMDGGVAGFVRFGHFLSGGAARPVVDQLIRLGEVKRAILGVRLTELPAGDPIRAAQPVLGDRPALYVDDVSAGSLAEKSGLQRGDFILELENQPVGDLPNWAGLLARGGEAKVVVVRANNVVRLTINLQPAN